MNLRFLLALWMGKMALTALKLTHHRGTDFPGTIALRICPDFTTHIKQPKTLLCVTGTNGKTTTTNLIAGLLEKDHQKVLCNKVGSNCLTGILTCLIAGSDLQGKTRYDIGVLEIDERSCKTIFPFLTPDYLIINNLTRDSIMRNAHPEYIANLFNQFIPRKTKLIINADDLISVGVAPNNPRTTISIARMSTDHDHCQNILNDMQICPHCQSKLSYEYVRYHHIGKAICPHCGYTNPQPDYLGTHPQMDQLTMDITNGKESCTFPLLTNGIHDMYNTLAAVALLHEFGYPFEKIAELMQEVKIVPSRYEELRPKDGYRIIRQMSKDINAVASSRAFEHVSAQPGQKEIIFLIFNRDDDIEWSENICWMQDCDFEFLNRPEITNIVCTGPRNVDFLLRLTMAGVPRERITLVDDRLKAHQGLRLDSPEDIYILFGTDAIEMSMEVAQSTCEEVLLRGKTHEN